MRKGLALMGLLHALPAAAGESAADHHFSEALYHAHQADPFEALARLDTELSLHRAVDQRELDSLYPDLPLAQFSVGDFELHYRMHQRAGRAMRALLAAEVDPSVRADAIVRLARLHIQTGAPALALETLSLQDTPFPDALRKPARFVRASALIALGRFDDAAEALRPLDGDEEIDFFGEYNLAIAKLGEGAPIEAARQLDRTGRKRPGNDASAAVRDKANLLLGTLLFEAGEFGRAGDVLDRVRLAGLHSDEALLRAGWSAAADEEYARAVVPWSILAERDPTAEAVQEALLALPYAYGELEVHGRAAQLYERAAGTFARELEKIDASIESIERGAFLAMLDDERIRQDRDWVLRMRELPDMPETFYLAGLIASHPFQTALQNYLDLSDMRRHLVDGRQSLEAFSDLVGVRRDYYEPRLPTIDRTFRSLDARMRLRLEQRAHLAAKLEGMLTRPAPRLLATAEELEVASRLSALRDRLPDRAEASDLHARLERLEGVLAFRLETRYHDRLDHVHRALRDLSADVEALESTYERFVRVRQAAQHGYARFDPTISDLQTRTGRAIRRIDVAREEQGRVLERLALRELEARRARLAEYQNKARFAFADSYDRAVKKQAARNEGGEP
ncbi:MAG: hypothetical protein AAGC67_04995 [Myxococcota bacterium]